jgi:hypothetical protein
MCTEIVGAEKHEWDTKTISRKHKFAVRLITALTGKNAEFHQRHPQHHQSTDPRHQEKQGL